MSRQYPHPVFLLAEVPTFWRGRGRVWNQGTRGIEYGYGSKFGKVVVDSQQSFNPDSMTNGNLRKSW